MRFLGWAHTERGRPIAVAYLVGQALLAVVWWIALFTAPEVRARFELSADRRGGLDAFIIGDALVFVGGSLLSAVLIRRRSARAGFATAFTAGGVAYATLYLAGWVALERTAVAGLAPMAASLVATTAIAAGTQGAPA